jgi:hypothetical protein
MDLSGSGSLKIWLNESIEWAHENSTASSEVYVTRDRIEEFQGRRWVQELSVLESR